MITATGQGCTRGPKPATARDTVDFNCSHLDVPVLPRSWGDFLHILQGSLDAKVEHRLQEAGERERGSEEGDRERGECGGGRRMVQVASGAGCKVVQVARWCRLQGGAGCKVVQVAPHSNTPPWYKTARSDTPTRKQTIY